MALNAQYLILSELFSEVGCSAHANSQHMPFCGIKAPKTMSHSESMSLDPSSPGDSQNLICDKSIFCTQAIYTAAVTKS